MRFRPQIIGGVIGLLFAFLVAIYCECADASYIQRFRKAPAVVVTAPPVPAGKIGDGSLRKHVLLTVVKHRVINKLTTVGDGKKKYTQAEAEAAYAKLTPQMIDGAIAEASPTAAGMVAGGRLSDFLDWLASHQDQILQIIEFIMKLIALFG